MTEFQFTIGAIVMSALGLQLCFVVAISRIKAIAADVKAIKASLEGKKRA